MAPKPAQDRALALRQEGLSEAEVRRRLQEDGYKSSRISQLLKATRGAAAAPEAGSYMSVVFALAFTRVP